MTTEVKNDCGFLVPEIWHGYNSVFSFPDGKLYRNLPGTKNGVKVVLEGQQKAIFTEFNASSFGGHSGVNKTISAIQKRYWWNGLTEDIKKFVSDIFISSQI